MTTTTENADTIPAAGDPPAARLGILAQYGMLAGPLLSMLDASIVNVAVAPIARQLHAPLAAVGWTVSGYLLALGVGLAATSWLARRFGTLPVYTVSLLGFTLASGCCAAAPDVRLLIAARLTQGLAGAPLVPLAMSMLLGGRGGTRTVSPLAGMLLFLAPALGPTVGGALIAAGGWRSIFLINVPIGVVAAAAARRIPARRAPGRAPTAPLDVAGLVLLAAGLTGVLAGASQGGATGWTRPASWAPLAAGATLLAAYAARAARHPHPALDLALLRHRTPALGMVLCAAASVVTFAAVFVLPVFAQAVQGHGAAATGLALLPQGVITGLGTVAGQKLLSHLSIRTTVIAGFAVLTAASLGLLAITATTPLAVTAAILAGRAAAIGLVITPLLDAITGTLRPGELADANSLFNICQRIAGALGIGLIAALYATWARRIGPVPALHDTGLILTAIAALATATAMLLPGPRTA
ncbi:MAG TPA: DHA2 family efflux MFS transporter permease subunit [Streptosporangiaceae bacterium]|nr:DHA2 family efflux MFS transporter permease subunit [Streptosporangiaceae bacterium]